MLFSGEENYSPSKTPKTRAPRNNCMPAEVQNSMCQKHRPFDDRCTNIAKRQKNYTLEMDQCCRSFLLASLFDSDTEAVTHTRKELSWSNTVSNANELFHNYVKQILWLCGTHQTTPLVSSKFSLEEWKWNGYFLGRLLYTPCLDRAHISNALGLNVLFWSILSWNVIPHNRNYSTDLIHIWSIIRTQNNLKILMPYSTDWWVWFP